MSFLFGREGKTGRFAETALPFFCVLFTGRVPARFVPWRNRCRAFPDARFSRLFPATLLLLAALAGGQLHAQAPSPLPAIPRLDSRDTLFRQYTADVEAARRALFSSRPDSRRAEYLASLLTVYSYTPAEGESLMAVAARCNIPYGTLASVNRFSHADDMTAGKPLLLPSMPGLFIPEKPDSDLERLLFSSGTEDEPWEGVAVSLPREGETERFRFIPGRDFSPTERIYFLNRGFSYPLQHFRLTSSYGPRVNPVTGKAGMHGGLDLAAPEGSEVYAVKSGVVAGAGEDPVLGTYVIVRHDNSWLSFYGHLSAVKTSVGAEVVSGGLIALVGSTGQSTGPHLHFELRQNGQSRDPARLLGLFSNR